MQKIMSEIMDDNFICMDKNQKIRELLQIIPKKKYTHVLVLDDAAEVIGIIAQKDIIEYFMGLLDGGVEKKIRDQELDEMTVEAIMTKTPITVSENDLFDHALELFIQHGFHLLPVLNEDKKIVGIITFDTLLFELKRMMNKSKNKSGFDFGNHRISSGWMYSSHR